jgi:hypothetical protein
MRGARVPARHMSARAAPTCIYMCGNGNPWIHCARNYALPARPVTSENHRIGRLFFVWVLSAAADRCRPRATGARRRARCRARWPPASRIAITASNTQLSGSAHIALRPDAYGALVATCYGVYGIPQSLPLVSSSTSTVFESTLEQTTHWPWLHPRYRPRLPQFRVRQGQRAAPELVAHGAARSQSRHAYVRVLQLCAPEAQGPYHRHMAPSQPSAPCRRRGIAVAIP